MNQIPRVLNTEKGKGTNDSIRRKRMSNKEMCERERERCERERERKNSTTCLLSFAIKITALISDVSIKHVCKCGKCKDHNYPH